MSAATFVSATSAERAAANRSMRFTTHSIVGIIGQPGRSAGLIVSMTSAGIDRQTIEVIRDDGTASSPPRLIERIARALTCLGPERSLARSYRQGLASGAAVVVVRRVPAGQHDAVSRLLQA